MSLLIPNACCRAVSCAQLQALESLSDAYLLWHGCWVCHVSCQNPVKSHLAEFKALVSALCLSSGYSRLQPELHFMCGPILMWKQRASKLQPGQSCRQSWHSLQRPVMPCQDFPVSQVDTLWWSENLGLDCVYGKRVCLNTFNTPDQEHMLGCSRGYMQAASYCSPIARWREWRGEL